MAFGEQWQPHVSDQQGSPPPDRPLGLFKEGLPFQVNVPSSISRQVEIATAPKITGLTVSASHQSGPLPPASEFKSYKEAHEPAAQWILDEAARSADQVRAMELRGMKIASRDALLFRILPFSIVALFLRLRLFSVSKYLGGCRRCRRDVSKRCCRLLARF